MKQKPPFSIRYKYVAFVFLFVALIYGHRSKAQTTPIWWIGGSGNSWSNGANWSTAGSGGGTCNCTPGTSNLVIFDGAGGATAGNSACTLPSTATVKGITMNGYTNTLTLNATLTTQGNNTFSSGSISGLSGTNQLVLDASVVIGTTTTFNSGFTADADVIGTTGSLFLNGAMFTKIVSVKKTVNTNDASNGGNTFMGDVSIDNASNGGTLTMADVNPDQFQGSTIFKVSNTNAIINPSRTGVGTIFSGTVTLNYAVSSGGIYFGANNGTSTFNSTVNVTCGTACGNLSLAQVSAGAATIDLTPNGSTVATITLGPGTNFTGNLIAIAPSLLLNGVTCTGGTTSLVKTGSSNDVSNGGNNFSGTTTSISNSGSGNLILGNTSADTFGDLYLYNAAHYIDANSVTHDGTGSIYLSNGSLNNQFNGDIYLNEQNVALQLNTGRGIYFSGCAGCVTDGSSKMVSGKRIRKGADYVAGELLLKNFTQLGSAPISLDFTTANPTGTVLYLGPGTTFGGDVSMTASRLFLNGATFNLTATLTKNGAGNDNGSGNNVFNATTMITNSGNINNHTTDGSFGTNGGNTFNGPVTITNNSRLALIMELTTGSVYSNAATFINSNGDGVATALIQVAYAGTTTFNGNVTVSNINTGNGIYFCSNGGATLTAALTATAAGFTTGKLNLQNVTQNSAASTNSVVMGGTLQIGPTVDIAGTVDFHAPNVLLNGAIYRGTTTIEKTSAAATSDAGTGGNTFMGNTTIVNSSSVNLQTNGNNTFNSIAGTTTTIQNTGAGTISLENATGQASTYSGNVTFSNSGTAGSALIRAGFAGTTSFNNNITVNSSGSSGGIYFGDNAAACIKVTLADAKNIAAGTFTTGELRLIKFTQGTTGMNTPQNITLSSSGGLRVGPSSTFNGDVTFSAPAVWLDGCNYKGPSNNSKITKTGTTSDLGLGGNVFSTDVTLANSGTGAFATAASGGSADTFGRKLTLNNSSSGTIRISDGVTGTTFADNIIINSTGSSGGIYFGLNNGASSLAEGKVIMNGNGVANTDDGVISFRYFTQGTTPQGTSQNLAFTSSGAGNAILVLGPSTTFNGDVTFTSPGVLLNGCDYKGVASLSKTGALNDLGTGGNNFEKKATLTNSGAGELRTATSTNDVFNDDLLTSNSGSGSISLAYSNPSATQFLKNVIFNSTNASGTSGVYLGKGGGGSTLATGSLLKTGDVVVPAGSGVTGGKIFLGWLQQTSGGVTDAQTLSFTHGANNPLLHISNSYFKGSVTFTADRILLDGSKFDGVNTFTKTGTTDDFCAGGNNFTGGASGTNTTTLVTTSSPNTTGNWAFSNSSPNAADTFSGPLVINKGGTANINLAHDVQVGATAFNNTVCFNSTATSGYITVGIGGHNGAVVNAAGVLSMGCALQAGVANGATVILGEVDIMSNQSINATVDGGTTYTGQLYLGWTAALSCHFRGNLAAKQRQVIVQYSVFDGNVTIEKTGSSTDASDGGNTFGHASGDVITLTNSGTGTFRLANTTGDIYKGATTFVQSGGTIQPAYNGTNNVYGDLTANASGTAITLAANAGNVTFSGSANQTIGIGASALSPVFKTMVMNQGAGGKVTLGTDITISNSLTFTAGVIYPGPGNYVVNFASGASTSGASSPGTSTSFVSGQVRKSVNAGASFTFPIGYAGGTVSTCRPLTISGVSTADVFTAQYFQSNPASYGTALAATLDNRSDCEYWMLNHTGAANAFVGLSWFKNDCPSYVIASTSDIKVAEWSGAVWQDLGGSGSGSASSGTVTSGSAVSAFGLPFTLASAVHATTLPIELESFAVYAQQNAAKLLWRTATELNNQGFEIYKSVDGKEFYKIGFVDGNGTTSQAHDYAFTDRNLISKSYYKLSQIDIDGRVVYSEVRLLNVGGEIEKTLTVYPNPAEKSAQLILQGVNEQESVRLEIFDSSGQLLKSYTGTAMDMNESFQVDTAGFTVGIYFVRVSIPGGQLHGKLVKL